MAKFKQSKLELIHPNAAGIDIGSASHFVAVPPDRDNKPVREFKSFTADLNGLADWLEAVKLTLWQWNRRGYTGFHCMNFWSRAG